MFLEFNARHGTGKPSVKIMLHTENALEATLSPPQPHISVHRPYSPLNGIHKKTKSARNRSSPCTNVPQQDKYP